MTLENKVSPVRKKSHWQLKGTDIYWSTIATRCRERDLVDLYHPAQWRFLEGLSIEEIRNQASEHGLNVTRNPKGGFRFTRRWSVSRHGMRKLSRSCDQLVAFGSITLAVASLLLVAAFAL